MKRCCLCKRVLDISFFHKNKTRPDGHMAECKDCSNERAREYGRKVRGYRPLLPRLSENQKKTHKQCPTCGQIKPKTMFYAAKRRHDGLSWQCKECEDKRKKSEAIKKKRLTYKELKDAKVHFRIENKMDSATNKGLDIVAHGVPLKDKKRKLPDNFNQEDVMDKPKVVYVTVKKSR